MSRHILWLDDGLARKEGNTSCLLELKKDGGVELFAQFLLSVGVNCSRGAFVGIEGDSLLALITHSSRLAAGLCCVRVCVVTLATPDS